ncbi:hypothetical protein ATCV1_z803R [Acanthocystis turfacea chlorella virus 1]|uniref:Uncharacterized protein z803R n=1 Tax=Chlorovirus heliozoae TaxID=322019 RepID=A7KA63_9PHYC|nr:hypothetical protein ATCV1_z803R [Acanthocystis turfacea chlorella virus 1]ABT16937.1 hypothetical protein ATCV1_z803R [Acanthocystis turfacea chlorella virus 1]
MTSGGVVTTSLGPTCVKLHSISTSHRDTRVIAGYDCDTRTHPLGLSFLRWNRRMMGSTLDSYTWWLPFRPYLALRIASIVGNAN